MRMAANSVKPVMAIPSQALLKAKACVETNGPSSLLRDEDIVQANNKRIIGHLINGYVASLATGFTLKAVNTAFGSCWFGAEHVDLISSDQNSWNGQYEALLRSDFHENHGEFGESCDANPELSISDKDIKCVETRCHPLRNGDEGIVRADKNRIV